MLAANNARDPARLRVRAAAALIIDSAVPAVGSVTEPSRDQHSLGKAGPRKRNLLRHYIATREP
jgi:hypothetical protein